MTGYFLRRLALVPLTLFGIMAVNFIFIQLAPGGPVEQVIAKIQGGNDAAARIAGSADRAYEDFHRKVLDMIRERGLENKVDRVGWIDIKKDFYSTLDIFVLPSNFEPFGIVLLEAMAFSKPVIASTAEGPSEIFADNGAALLFEKGNAGDLADKIAEMISDSARAAACAEKGYELVRSRYDLETTGAETLDRAVKSVFERL